MAEHLADGFNGNSGFDYSTTAALTEKNIVTDDEGSLWIETHRIKTGTV